jgi:DNA polymerase epsilon subunit 1
LYAVRREILPLAQSNSASLDAVDAYAEVVSAEAAASGFDEDDAHGTRAWGDEGGNDPKRKDKEPSDCVIDVREYDINYYLRVAIDLSKSSKAAFR